jgi:phosphonatase-like hydrolase
MNIQLVVFDMAGTTVMDKGNVNDAFRQAFLTEDITVDAADIDKVMGYKKIEAVKIIVDQYAPALNGQRGTQVINDIHDVFIKNMIEFYENDPDLQPLPFAEAAFQELKEKGIKVALNTGFTRSIADAVLTRLGWNNSSLIDVTVCSDEVAEGRPYPFMIQSLMQQLMIEDIKSVAKIGDTEVDIKEGRNAGCGLVVGITTGSYSREELQKYHPDFIIDSLQQLSSIIQ